MQIAMLLAFDGVRHDLEESGECESVRRLARGRGRERGSEVGHLVSARFLFFNVA